MQQISPTNFLVTLEDPRSINHLSVFLTGQSLLPADAAALIYLKWSDQQDWKYLGALTNEKPSAIFKTKHLVSEYAINVIQMGISIEPLHNIPSGIDTQLAPLSSFRVSQMDQMELITKVAKTFVNFASSFLVGNQTSIPVSALNDWFQKLISRLKMEPNYLEKIDA